MAAAPSNEVASDTLTQARPPFLRRVRIRGYKSIAFCDVALEPLMVLVGGNASGKSSFLDVLAFLRDALAGVNDLPDLLPPRDQLEDLCGTAWLEAQLRSKSKVRKYQKPDDPEVFVRAMALRERRGSSPSFDKLCRDREARLPQPPGATGPTTEAAPTQGGGTSS